MPGFFQESRPKHFNIIKLHIFESNSSCFQISDQVKLINSRLQNMRLNLQQNISFRAFALWSVLPTGGLIEKIKRKHYRTNKKHYTCEDNHFKVPYK